MSGGTCERLTLVFPGALGDFLLALPALRAVCQRHAGLPTTLVVHEPLRSLAALAGGWTVASLDDRASVWLFGGSVRPEWLEGRPCVWTWLGAGNADVRRRLGMVASDVHMLHVERGAEGAHAAVAYVRAVGAVVDRATLVVTAAIRPPASDRAQGLLAAESRPILAVHPGAGARGKRWDPAGFVQVAHWWVRHGGVTVEIAGPAEASEAPLLGDLVAREWALGDLSALLAASAAFLGNDSGVTHLAAAVGAAGVGLFGPTPLRRWRPMSPRFRALAARRAGDAGIPLDALPVSRVIATLRRVFTLTTPYPTTSVRA